MKTNRLLISSAMLTAMCEDKAVDNLKLLERLTMICIAETNKIGEFVNIADVLAKMEEKFAFQEMPEAVIEKIFQRMSHQGNACLSCGKRKNYTLIRDLDAVLDDYREREGAACKDTSEVIDALVKWLNEKKPVLGANREKAEEWLANFLEIRGVDVLFDVDELLEDTISSTDIIHYQISQFILSVRTTDAPLFNKLVNIVEGTMIAAAMFVNSPEANRFTRSRRLTGVTVYLDTTFLLYALNYKLDEQKKAADALLDLLRENGASLLVFPQHYTEIKDILKTFRDRDAYSLRVSQPLERLEAERYTSIEIDHEINTLEESLKKLGIALAPKEARLGYNEATQKERFTYIDYNSLKSHILNKIPKYDRSIDMLENDLDAISYVLNERGGIRYSTIESSVAIFVTTNDALVRESNRFLRYDPYKMNISPIISDVDLTSILWVKYDMKTSDIPRIHLIEAARAAATPSASVMRSFFDITNRFVKKGRMSEDEAADIRFSAYARAEIMSECGGDAAALDDTSVLAVQNRVREKYAANAIAGEATAKQIAKEANQKACDMEKRLLTQQSSIKKEIGGIRRNACLDAKASAEKISKETLI